MMKLLKFGKEEFLESRENHIKYWLGLANEMVSQMDAESHRVFSSPSFIPSYIKTAVKATYSHCPVNQTHNNFVKKTPKWLFDIITHTYFIIHKIIPVRWTDDRLILYIQTLPLAYLVYRRLNYTKALSEIISTIAIFSQKKTAVSACFQTLSGHGINLSNEQIQRQNYLKKDVAKSVIKTSLNILRRNHELNEKNKRFNG